MKKPPLLKELKAVQLALPIPQMDIDPRKRVLVLSGKFEGKTGRVVRAYKGNHYVQFRGRLTSHICRSQLVEIQ